MKDVVVVERARMDKILEEASFTNFSVQADPTTATKFGKMVGAQILITGTLLNFNKQKKKFMGFGVRTSSETGVIKIRVRAYNVEKGILLFSNEWTGSATKVSTSFGRTGTEDIIAASLENAFEKLKNDQKFLSIFAEAKETTKTIKKVKVEFKPVPNNCDIEIKGIFYGNSPLVVELPEGVTVKVKISKPGYIPWEKSISPREGMKISPELIKKDK